MRWLRKRGRRWSYPGSEVPDGPASRSANPSAPLAAGTGEAPLRTAEAIDLERSIARRARAASREPSASADDPFSLVRKR